MDFPIKIIKSLIAIRDELEAVPKDGENPHFHYKYVTEQAMQAALRPLLKKHGLLIVSSANPNFLLATDQGGYYNAMYAYRICHIDGEVWPEMIYVPAQDKGDKASWKANTGAFKYLLNRLFMLDTDTDPEGKHDTASKPSPRAAPQQPEVPRAPTQETSGFTLVKGHIKTKQVFGAGFAASEEAHGKDKAMKFHSINASCKAMGYLRLDAVPVELADELLQLIKSYPQWWNKPSLVDEEDESSF